MIATGDRRKGTKIETMPNKPSVLFFDLENTLINHWTDQQLCWTEQNRRILETCEPCRIGIFSFALWCDENIKTFIYEGMKEMVEKEYEITVNADEIIHVNDMIDAYNNVNTEKSHPNGHNKKGYFLSWLKANKHRFKYYGSVWLVDDTIDDGSIVDTEWPFVIHFRNPVEIEDFI